MSKASPIIREICDEELGTIQHEVEYTLPELLAKVRQTASEMGIEISAKFYWATTPQSLSAEIIHLANLIEESYGYKIELYTDTVGRNERTIR